MTDETPKPRTNNARTEPRLTKKAQLIRMLSTKMGTDVVAISKKLGWQSHTTRAALTGLKKAGYEISSEKRENGKDRRYRITGEPKPKMTSADGSAANPEASNAG